MIRTWLEAIWDEEARRMSVKGMREDTLSLSVPVRFDPPETDPSKYRIKIIGVGGMGCNSINRLYQRGMIGAELISMDTDALHLLMGNSTRKVLLGRSITRGLGTGALPEVGKSAALEEKQQIDEVLGRPEIVFVICGLGGGPGSGAAPVVARVANDLGAMTVAMCTMPFVNEGLKCGANARRGLTKLTEVADVVLAVPNERLVESLPRISLNAAFGTPDEVFVRAIRGMTEGYAMTDNEAHWSGS